MTDQPLPQPGWYADPAGSPQDRYWEGTRWTKNVRDRPDPLPGTDTATSETVVRVLHHSHQSPPMPPQQFGPGAAPGTYPPQSPIAYKMVRTTEDGVPLAGFWQRALATLIDVVLMSLIGGLVAWPFLVRVWRSLEQMMAWSLDNPGAAVPVQDYDYLTPFSAVQYVILAISFVSQVLLVRFFGGTVGQLLLGLRVVPSEKGLTRRVSWNTSLLRSGIWLAVMAASQVVLFPAVISYLRPLWHPRLKTWHDSMAGTQVITTRGPFAQSVLSRTTHPMS